MEREWAEWQTGVRLVTLHSLYRSVLTPLSEFIDMVKAKADKKGARVTVVMPQFITKKWWHGILHNQSGFLIMAYLLRMRDVIVTIVPYQLQK
jgi:hypothetical protein